MGNGHWLPLLVIIGVVTAFQAPRLLHLDRPSQDTDWLQNASLCANARIAIAGFHQLPVRTHLLGGGYPSLGHPLDLSLTPALVFALLTNERVGLNLYAFMLHLLAAAGMYLYCQSTLRMRGVAPVYAALLLALCSAMPVRIWSGKLGALTHGWLPLALFLLGRGQRSRASLACLALVLCAAMAAGGSAWTALALYLSCYAALHAVGWGRGRLRVRLYWPVALLCAVAVAMALSAPKLVAAFDLLRPGGPSPKPVVHLHAGYYSSGHIEALSWAELGQHLLGRQLALDRRTASRLYVGLAPLLLAAAAIRLRRLWRHVLLLALAGMLIVAWHSPVDLLRLAWFIPLVDAIDKPVK